jgi:FKBP-type peptidyl-prolyl cis-trans isomerase FkpA
MRSAFYILCGCVAFAISCNDHSLAISAETQHIMDLEKIDTYLASKGITAQQHESGLRYIINQQGTGDFAGPDKCIRATCSIWFLDEDAPKLENKDLTTPLSQTFLGMRIGMKELQKGGTITLYLTSNLAFGTAGKIIDNLIIPANQCLIWQVTLVNVTKFNSAGQYCEPWP